MTDDQFKALCNTYGFAPSRALRELIDCVRAQEIEACAKVCDEIEPSAWHDGAWSAGWSDGTEDCAAAIRARKDKQ